MRGFDLEVIVIIFTAAVVVLLGVFLIREISNYRVAEALEQQRIEALPERNQWGQLPMTQEQRCIATIEQWLKKCETDD